MTPTLQDFCLSPDVERQAARERPARLRQVLVANNIGAAIHFDAVNIREGRASARQRERYGRAHEQLQHNLALLAVGLSFRDFADRTWPIPAAYVDHRYLSPVHGNGMAGEYPVIPYPDLFDNCGQEGVFEAGMTVCVESFVGDRAGGEGVKLEEQALRTPHGVERLTTYPCAPRLQ